MKPELKRCATTNQTESKELGMSMNNFNLKINGKVPFTVEEAKAVQKAFCPDVTLDYLLANDAD